VTRGDISSLAPAPREKLAGVGAETREAEVKKRRFTGHQRPCIARPTEIIVNTVRIKQRVVKNYKSKTINYKLNKTTLRNNS